MLSERPRDCKGKNSQTGTRRGNARYKTIPELAALTAKKMLSWERRGKAAKPYIPDFLVKNPGHGQ